MTETQAEPKKAPRAKKPPAPPKPKKVDNILAARAEVVGIDAIKPYAKNPRVGDVKAIADSLAENGQFKPIVVNRKTMEILGGNHTWKAAKSLGWSKIAVVFLDVNEERAKRIVLADNRTNDLASYDTDILADILASLPSPAGTGYDDEAFSKIVKGLDKTTEDIEAIMRPNPVAADETMIEQASNYQPPEEDNRFVPPADMGKPDAVAPVTTRQAGEGGVLISEDGEFEKAFEEVKGAYGLKYGFTYDDGVGEWGIPPLLPSMLVQPDEVPRNLKAWAGSATKDWPDPDQWWLYNYGVDSTSGMKDITKVIMSFFCWDEYFEKVFEAPDRFTGKMINSGIKMAVTPDYSTWSAEPLVLSLLAVYKARYMGRYFQEAGIRVIPHVGWPMGNYKFAEEIVRNTLPKDLPVVAMQLQTFDTKATKEEIANLVKIVRHMGKLLNPQLTIFYLGKLGMKFFTENPDVWPGEHLLVANRMTALAAQAKQRGAKNTI